MKSSTTTVIFLMLAIMTTQDQVQKVMCVSLGKTSNVLRNSTRESETVEIKLDHVIDGKKLIYNLHAFGENLKLVLKQNNAPVVEHAYVIKRHDGRTVSKEKIADLGYYVGYIHSKPGSSVSVKIRDGYLSGVIFTDSHYMTIYGSPDKPRKHVITKQNHDKNTLEKYGYPVLPSSHGGHSAITKRSATVPRHLEVMLVSDSFTTEAYGNFTEQYLMSLAYYLSALMLDDSIGDIKVVYTVVKFMILSGDEKGLDVSESRIESSLSYLSLFAQWVKQFNNPDDSHPEHFDQAVLISKRICGLKSSCSENGRGYLGGMCSSSLSVASAVAAGLSAALTAAHETGHNFGLGHDSGECAKGYIMQAGLSAGKNAFSWSKCSREKLQEWFNNKNKMACLNDMTLSSTPDSRTINVLNLAKNYSGDDQCRLMYGPKYSQCGPLKSNCKTLYCIPAGANYCIHRSTPPLEGTICGVYKWCVNGECVDQPIPDPIDGNWGPWSSTFSQCTRSCGMGVRHRTRNCDNPKPEFFGKECFGESKGHYETCNTHDCPDGTPTFRLQQCLDISPKFTDYFTEDAKCSLRCISGGVVSYYSTVKDGTLCSKYKDVYDVCVLGKCKEVGCDRAFSRKYYDRCRVCAGDGSTCELVSDTYSTDHRGYDSKNAAVMFILPKGATNLFLKESASTYNEIGIKDQNDNWVIGPRSGTMVKYFAGTRIMYERKGSAHPDALIIIGPTTEPLKITFTYLYEKNPGVPYSYYRPLSTPVTGGVSFIWNYTLTECTQTCAGGVQLKITKCYRSDDNTEVGIQHCDAATEPTGSVPCNTQACEPRWAISEWSQCSAKCGPSGKKTRTVECRQKLSNANDKILPDDQCQGTKSSTEENCNRQDCGPDWEPGPWSECSRKKCEGIQTRQLHCKKLLVTGAKQVLTDSDCITAKPISELKCNTDVPCYEWRPVYPSCSQCQAYFPDSGSNSLTHKEVGCYNFEKKLFGAMLLKNNVDPSDKMKTVAECGRVSWDRARRVFAVGGNGECYSAMDSHTNYNEYGRSSSCVDKIGGNGAVYVYAINGQVLVSDHACFYVEDDSKVANSKCLGEMPDPEIKLCCEEMCQDYCYKTEDDGYCAIPFIYKGQMHYNCIENDSGRLWCATTSNYDIDAKGANCKEPCRQQTRSGECCSFPFIYRGRLYNSCVTDSGEPWCALTSNYDIDFKKGICV